MKKRRHIRPQKSLAELTREFDQRCAEAQRSKRVRTRSKRPGTYSESRPLTSFSIGCHVDQIAERNAMLRRHGITGAHYNPAGICEMTSRSAERAVCKLLGKHPNR